MIKIVDKKKIPNWGFSRKLCLFLDLLVFSLLLAPFAEFVEFDLLSDKFLVLAGPVVDTLAGTAGELYKSIL